MNNDIRKLFSEKNIIEKKLNSIKMEIMLSDCDKNKDDCNSNKDLESPFKKIVDMLKDAAVGVGLMAWGFKWLTDEKSSIFLDAVSFAFIVLGISICLCSICWFLINCFKINYIESERKKYFLLTSIAIVSVLITLFCFLFIKGSIENEKVRRDICSCEQVK